MLEFASVRFRPVGTDPASDPSGYLVILLRGIEWVSIQMQWPEVTMCDLKCRDSGVLLCQIFCESGVLPESRLFEPSFPGFAPATGYES